MRITPRRTTARRIPRRLLLSALATCVALLALVGPLAGSADAHATLLGTTPADDELLGAAPDAVELRFDEAVEVADDSVQVIGPDGRRVDRAAVETAEDNTVLRARFDGEDRGTYTVGWRVTSADSHTISGSFVFHVGERTGAAELDDDDDLATRFAGFLGRWLGFVGSLVAVGGAGLALLAGRDAAVRATLRPLVGGAAVVGVLGILVALVGRVAENAGRSWLDAMSLVPEAVGDTRSAGLMALRAALLWLAAVAALMGVVWRRWWPLGVLLLGVASLVTASLGGHPWTSDQRWLAVVADVAHLAAVSTWIGGLVALLVALPVAVDRAQLARRFSGLALGAAVLVAFTGVISGLQNVDSLDGLTTTGYGRLLVGKVALFVGLLGFGWANRARLVPIVQRTVAPLTRSLRGEVAVAAIVVGLTAALVNQPPPRGPTALVSEPFSATVAATSDAGEQSDATLQIEVLPAQAGPNDLHLYFRDADGAPLNVDAVQIVVAIDDVPERRLDVQPITPDHVSVIGASLPTSGTWTIETTAVRQGVPLVFTVEVEIT